MMNRKLILVNYNISSSDAVSTGHRSRINIIEVTLKLARIPSTYSKTCRGSDDTVAAVPLIIECGVRDEFQAVNFSRLVNIISKDWLKNAIERDRTRHKSYRQTKNIEWSWRFNNNLNKRRVYCWQKEPYDHIFGKCKDFNRVDAG